MLARACRPYPRPPPRAVLSAAPLLTLPFSTAPSERIGLQGGGFHCPATPSPRQLASPSSLSLLIHLSGLRLLQLRMEKEEMEEELREKIEVLQRELGQARAGAGDSRQVEELKKVLGRWGAEGQVGVMGTCLPTHEGPHTSVAVCLCLVFRPHPVCSALSLPACTLIQRGWSH